MNQDIYAWFIDFKKTFDNVNRGKLIELLKQKQRQPGYTYNNYCIFEPTRNSKVKKQNDG